MSAEHTTSRRPATPCRDLLDDPSPALRAALSEHGSQAEQRRQRDETRGGDEADARRAVGGTTDQDARRRDGEAPERAVVTEAAAGVVVTVPTTVCTGPGRR
jgi:hypothetical protein